MTVRLALEVLSVLALVIGKLTKADNINGYDVRTFRIDLDAGVPRMLDLIRETHVPNRASYPILSGMLDWTLMCS